MREPLVGIIRADAGGRVSAANEDAARLLRRSIDDLVGSPLPLHTADGVPPDLDLDPGETRPAEIGDEGAVPGERLAATLSRLAEDSGGELTLVLHDSRLVDGELSRLAAAVESVTDAVLVTDRAGTISYANPAFVRMSGYPLDELLGESPRILQSGRHDAAFYRALSALLEAGGTWEGELVNRRRDGSLYVEEARIAPIRLPDGRIDGYVQAGRDVSAARAESRALRASEARLREILEGIDGIVAYRSDAHEPVTHSPQTIRILGHEPWRTADFEFWRSLIHPDDLAGCEAAWGSAADEWELEYRMRRADGEWIWVRDRGRRTSDGAGRTGRLFAIVVDVTEAKEAAAAAARADALARERHAEFQELFHGAPISAWLFRLVAGDDGTIADLEILDLNEDAVRTLERPAGEVIGRMLSEFVPQETAERSLEMAREVLATGTTRQQENRIGDRAFLSSGFRLGGDRYAVVGFEVTDLERAREIYDRAQRMEALGELASGVGHDFKNILWGIGLYAAGLAGERPADDPVRADALLIQEAVAHGMGLATQLLDFARRGRGVPDVVDLATLVPAIAPMLERLLGEPRRLEIRPLPSLPIEIDPTRLEQALINLTVNARDAMPTGGTVTIGADEVALEEEEARLLGIPSGRYARIEVADTGCGIEPAVATRIFEPYFTTKGAGKGTGLGLATTFATVTGAGGAIGVESEPGSGCRFRIHLPLAEGARVSAGRPARGSRAPRAR